MKKAGTQNFLVHCPRCHAAQGIDEEVCISCRSQIPDVHPEIRRFLFSLRTLDFVAFYKVYPFLLKGYGDSHLSGGSIIWLGFLLWSASFHVPALFDAGLLVFFLGLGIFLASLLLGHTKKFELSFHVSPPVWKSNDDQYWATVKKQFFPKFDETEIARSQSSWNQLKWAGILAGMASIALSSYKGKALEDLTSRIAQTRARIYARITEKPQTADPQIKELPSKTSTSTTQNNTAKVTASGAVGQRGTVPSNNSKADDEKIIREELKRIEERQKQLASGSASPSPISKAPPNGSQPSAAPHSAGAEGQRVDIAEYYFPTFDKAHVLISTKESKTYYSLVEVSKDDEIVKFHSSAGGDQVLRIAPTGILLEKSAGTFETVSPRLLRPSDFKKIFSRSNIFGKEECRIPAKDFPEGTYLCKGSGVQIPGDRVIVRLDLELWSETFDFGERPVRIDCAQNSHKDCLFSAIDEAQDANILGFELDLRQGCDAKDFRSCLVLASYYGGKGNRQSAQRVAEKWCRAEKSASDWERRLCVAQALAQVDQEPHQATKLLEAACLAGTSYACQKLVKVELSLGNLQSAQRAEKFLNQMRQNRIPSSSENGGAKPQEANGK